MGWILFFSIGIPLLCLPACVLIEMTKPKEERWGQSQPNQAVSGSVSGSMKNPPSRPSAFVGLETTQHPADPRTLKPVQGLTEYVPIYSQAFLPAEHQLDLVTMDSGGNTNLQLSLYNGQLVLEAPNGLLPNRSSGQVYRLGIYTGSMRGYTHYEKAVLNADTRPLAKAELVREPGNEYDKNAVAIHAPGAGRVGYVNKQNAARLSKRLDAGEKYMAIFTSGCNRGGDSVPVSVLIAPTTTMMSIFRNSGIPLPSNEIAQ